LETLQAVTNGELPLESALAELTRLLKVAQAKEPASLEFARVDLARHSRQGVAEVIFGEGKTVAQILEIAATLRKAGQSVLVTRVSEEKAEQIIEKEPRLKYDQMARVLYEQQGCPNSRFSGKVGIVAAGTSDLPVVREAQITLELNGEEVETFVDVGVAGLHRLLRALPKIQEMSALICVAGMEGALASVLGGLVKVPLICVPTSVGYGAALNGLSALSGMLTSCSSGATVVNIDNGFGAAMAVIRLGDLVQSESQRLK